VFIPDMQEFPSGHPPTPYGFPLLLIVREVVGRGVLPAGTILRAVGWLGNQVPRSGDTREECVDRLVLAYESDWVFDDCTKGWHECEICTTKEQRRPGGKIGPVIHWRGRDLRLIGHGHYLIRSQDIVYMAPGLVLHYILDHHYRPPNEFVDAVIAGSFLTDEDLTFIGDEDS